MDTHKIRRDAYFACKNNSVCSAVVDATDSEILNYMYKDAYKETEKKAMSNDAWTAARTKAENYYLIAKDKTSNDWFKLVDEYYLKML